MPKTKTPAVAVAPKPPAVATHTPGPWQTSDHDARGVYADGGAALLATVHTTTIPERELPSRMDVTAANARLISASPELLEACEAAKAILNAYIPPDAFDGHAARALIMVRDAIVKARGGADA